MTDIAVIILVGNEEIHIRRCIEKLAPLEPRQVCVVESQNGDKTHEILEELKWQCPALENVFHTYPGNQAAQFNWALDNLGIEAKWVLRLDADEYLTDETVAKLREKFAFDGGVVSSQSLVVGGGDAGVGDSVGDSGESRKGTETRESGIAQARLAAAACPSSLNASSGGAGLDFAECGGRHSDEDTPPSPPCGFPDSPRSRKEETRKLGGDGGVVSSQSLVVGEVDDSEGLGTRDKELGASEEPVLYTLELRHTFMGGEIRHGTAGIRIPRLFRYGRARYGEAIMDERLTTDGIMADFDGEFFDDNLNSFEWWQEKHRGYAKREAAQAIAGNFHDPRKAKYYRLPPYLRAFMYFCLRYFVKGGFLDGLAGWRWHFWQGLWYRCLVDREIGKLRS